MKRCYLCGDFGKVHVHHIDGNHSNDCRENRIQLCEFCHSRVHQMPELPSRVQFFLVREKVFQRAPELFDLPAEDFFGERRT